MTEYTIRYEIITDDDVFYLIHCMNIASLNLKLHDELKHHVISNLETRYYMTTCVIRNTYYYYKDITHDVTNTTLYKSEKVARLTK